MHQLSYRILGAVYMSYFIPAWVLPRDDLHLIPGWLSSRDYAFAILYVLIVMQIKLVVVVVVVVVYMIWSKNVFAPGWFHHSTHLCLGFGHDRTEKARTVPLSISSFILNSACSLLEDKNTVPPSVTAIHMRHEIFKIVLSFNRPVGWQRWIHESLQSPTNRYCSSRVETNEVYLKYLHMQLLSRVNARAAFIMSTSTLSFYREYLHVKLLSKNYQDWSKQNNSFNCPTEVVSSSSTTWEIEKILPRRTSDTNSSTLSCADTHMVNGNTRSGTLASEIRERSCT